MVSCFGLSFDYLFLQQIELLILSILLQVTIFSTFHNTKVKKINKNTCTHTQGHTHTERALAHTRNNTFYQRRKTTTNTESAA